MVLGRSLPAQQRAHGKDCRSRLLGIVSLEDVARKALDQEHMTDNRTDIDELLYGVSFTRGRERVDPRLIFNRGGIVRVIEKTPDEFKRQYPDQEPIDDQDHRGRIMAETVTKQMQAAIDRWIAIVLKQRHD